VPIYALGDLEPRIDASAFVHPEAVIIGDVTIGPEASVWPCAVLRGDEAGGITVGARTSIQDGTVVHCTAELPTIIGADCVIGHLVHLEGCTIEDGALVGNAAVVLHEAVVSTGAVVGSNAVVSPRTIVPPGALALGVPATIREGKAEPRMIEHARDIYVGRAKQYAADLRRIG
jgi:carbonic anhydrase/acetyltransferase-like protein (isoleucine patch superfamily)